MNGICINFAQKDETSALREQMFSASRNVTTLSHKWGFDRADVLPHWFRWHVCSRGPAPAPAHHSSCMLSPICLPRSEGRPESGPTVHHEGDVHARLYPNPLMASDMPRPLEGGPLAGGQAERHTSCAAVRYLSAEYPQESRTGSEPSR